MKYFSVVDGKIKYFQSITDAIKQNLNRPLFKKTKTGQIIKAKYSY